MADLDADSNDGKISLYKSWFDATNAKAAKGTVLGFANAIHYMSPHTAGGAGNVCPWAGRCVAPCLNSSGKGGAPNVIAGRKRRAEMYFDSLRRDGGRSYTDLHRLAIDNPRSNKTLVAVAKRMGLRPVLRLNGTSDIEYEKLGIFQDYPALDKYDYTKGWERYLDWLEGKRSSGGFRSNGAGAFRDVKRYHLTLSLGGTLDRDPKRAGDVYRDVLDRGGTVAAVWTDEERAKEAIRDGIDAFIITDQDGKPVKRIGLGGRRQVIDGNVMNGDIRFLDPPGVIVGLYAKGRTIMKDAGRAFWTPCPRCGSKVAWSGEKAHKPTCMKCSRELYPKGSKGVSDYYTFKPTIKGSMVRHGEQFFMNPSSRRSSSSSGGALVFDSLAMGQIKQGGDVIHIPTGE